jgi:hypothetical protein
MLKHGAEMQSNGEGSVNDTFEPGINGTMLTSLKEMDFVEKKVI